MRSGVSQVLILALALISGVRGNVFDVDAVFERLVEESDPVIAVPMPWNADDPLYSQVAQMELGNLPEKAPSLLYPKLRPVTIHLEGEEEMKKFAPLGPVISLNIPPNTRVSALLGKICGLFRKEVHSECEQVFRSKVTDAIFPELGLIRGLDMPNGLGWMTVPLQCKRGETRFSCAQSSCARGGREGDRACIAAVLNDAVALSVGAWRSALPDGVSPQSASSWVPLHAERDRSRFLKGHSGPLPQGLWSRYWMLARAMEDDMLGSGFAVYDGHTGHSPGKIAHLLHVIASRPDMKHVCEIGFNAGHSALAMLAARDDVHVTSFELGGHSYSYHAASVLDAWFPGRLQLRIGDSTIEIPKFIEDSMEKHGEVQCDIWFIDGGHSYLQILADTMHAIDAVSTRKNQRRKWVAIFDDFGCDMSHCIGTRRAIAALSASGHLIERGIIYAIDRSVNLESSLLDPYHSFGSLRDTPGAPDVSQLRVAVEGVPSGLISGVREGEAVGMNAAASSVLNALAIAELAPRVTQQVANPPNRALRGAQLFAAENQEFAAILQANLTANPNPTTKQLTELVHPFAAAAVRALERAIQANEPVIDVLSRYVLLPLVDRIDKASYGSPCDRQAAELDSLIGGE